ncbi:MAG: phosphohydrolase [Endomicrobiia bacterium]
MEHQCPGQSKRELFIRTKKCNNCGYEVEIFSDEQRVVCPKCKQEVFYDKISNCADWCMYAEKCLGKDKQKKF